MYPFLDTTRAHLLCVAVSFPALQIIERLLVRELLLHLLVAEHRKQLFAMALRQFRSQVAQVHVHA